MEIKKSDATDLPAPLVGGVVERRTVNNNSTDDRTAKDGEAEEHQDELADGAEEEKDETDKDSIAGDNDLQDEDDMDESDELSGDDDSEENNGGLDQDAFDKN